MTYEQLNIYKKGLRSSVRYPIAKIEWLDKNYNTIKEVTTLLQSGSSVSIEYKNGTRRTVRLTLVNEYKDFIPNEDGLIWFNKAFRLYSGMRIDGIDYWNEQGVFRIGNPALTSEFAQRSVNLEGYDLFSLLDGKLGGKLEYDYVVPQGKPIAEAIRQIIVESGTNLKTIINPELETKSFPYTLTENRGSSLGALLEKMAEIFSHEVYVDVHGILRFVEQVDQNKEAPLDILGVNERLYQGSVKNYEFINMFNAVRIWGRTTNNHTFTGYAEDLNIFSPTYIKKIDKKVQVINDAQIFTDELAQKRADFELKKLIQLYESVEVKCIPNDLLDVGKILLIEDEYIDSKRDRHLITRVNLPLDFNGQMSLTVWKTRNVYDTTII